MSVLRGGPRVRAVPSTKEPSPQSSPRGRRGRSLARSPLPLRDGQGEGAYLGPLLRLAALALALVLDAALGEPSTAVHPVVWIGRLISWLNARAPQKGRVAQLAYGAGVALAVPAAAALPAALLGRAARRWHPLVRVAVAALALKPTFAARDLFAHLERVRAPLAAGRLDDARASLQMIVSRDTQTLSPELVAAAAVESAAENASDSFVAPLLYYLALGPAGSLAYRASNTLDAMIGYHGRYEYLGKAAARLDDLANLIPSRLTALLIAIASPLGQGDPRRAWRMAREHHGRTESPNAGWPMAAMAGALGVELEKVGHYRLGEPKEHLRPEHVRRAMRIVAGAMVLAAGLVGIALVGAASAKLDGSRRRGVG